MPTCNGSKTYIIGFLNMMHNLVIRPTVLVSHFFRTSAFKGLSLSLSLSANYAIDLEG